MAVKLEEYKGEMLGDVLSKIEGNIKLGTNDGGAFFYCGPVNDLYDKLSKMNAEAKIEAVERVNRAKAALQKAIETLPTFSDYVQKEFKKSKGKKVGTLIGYFNSMNNDLAKLEDRMAKIILMENEEYVPLLSREIVDVRLSLDEPNTTIIVIRGREVGRYWTVNEYLNGVVEEEDDDDTEYMDA